MDEYHSRREMIGQAMNRNAEARPCCCCDGARTRNSGEGGKTTHCGGYIRHITASVPQTSPTDVLATTALDTTALENTALATTALAAVSVATAAGATAAVATAAIATSAVGTTVHATTARDFSACAIAVL